MLHMERFSKRAAQMTQTWVRPRERLSCLLLLKSDWERLVWTQCHLIPEPPAQH